MNNLTQFSSFILDGYLDIGPLSYLYFILIIFLFVLIILANTVLIYVICEKRSLHEPMYLFLVNLFVNELYGSAGIFPSLMVQLLSDVHSVSKIFCFVQIFGLYTYATTELGSFAVMAYDRYLAICYPMHYRKIMTPNKVLIYICMIWSFSFLQSTIILALTNRLKFCGNVMTSVYCNNYLIVKLACSIYNTRVNNIYGLVAIVWSVVLPLIPILFSYIRILTICSNGSKETRQKAIATCTPHLVSLLNFSFGCFFEIVQSRFNMTYVPNICRIILSLYFLICQPIFSPVVYGLRMTKIKEACKDFLLSKL
ncbi:olfactory receptor 11A1-like [Aplochiton taeniatus]